LRASALYLFVLTHTVPAVSLSAPPHTAFTPTSGTQDIARVGGQHVSHI
jgi:hypothetical protein